MTAAEGMLALEQPAQRRVLREHEVRTLASLQSALTDLVTFALKNGAKGPIDLPDFLHGLTVSLNDDGCGYFFVKFQGKRR